MKKLSRTNWTKLKSMKDREINDSDIPKLNKNFFKKAQIKLPESKALVTIRLDPDIIQWFKKQGRGYQTRINAVLRLYVQQAL
ncbi:MAG: BrnA antitoxin family protein [Deltaproteobacteria bacterium]|nr:MAG: BrnA antitoxin family protein [Deltaproteobacteria bacterium]